MTVTEARGTGGTPGGPPAGEGVCLRRRDGVVLDLPTTRWLAAPSAVDLRVLVRVAGPVLDVGCGPGRHVLSLAAAGVVTLGIDISPPALRVAHAQGAPVLHRSVFERVPGAGRWGTALLLDGNVGIGGCPLTLLRRASSLLRGDGRLLVELDAADGRASVEQVRFETAEHAGPWFAWTHVGPGELEVHAADAGLAVVELWRDGDRTFAQLRR
ncbi:MAG TPA: class I SAM-dependent methyltransferase [Acidimicrobiia bacterium]|nr:class I SAM-dependent methyltransferase [Acidimicrobiia bacterium]